MNEEKDNPHDSNDEVTRSALIQRVEKLEHQFHLLLESRAIDGSSHDTRKPSADLLEYSSNITKFITTAFTAVAEAAFVFYAFGFIIVNLYELSFGIREFDLAKPVYLPAGVIFLIATLVPLLAPFLVEIITTSNPKNRKSQSYEHQYRALIRGEASFRETFTYQFKSGLLGDKLVRLVTTLAVCLFFQVVILAVLTNPESIYTGKQVGSFAKYLTWFGILLFLAFGSRAFTESGWYSDYDIVVLAGEQDRVNRARASAIRSLIPFVPVFLLMLLAIWSYTVYPDVSPAFGGGRRPAVQLGIVDASAEELFNQIGITVVSHVTEPLELVDDDSQTLTVLLKNGNAVALPKSLIKTVIYLKSNSDNSLPTPINIPTPLVSTPVPK